MKRKGERWRESLREIMRLGEIKREVKRKKRD